MMLHQHKEKQTCHLTHTWCLRVLQQLMFISWNADQAAHSSQRCCTPLPPVNLPPEANSGQSCLSTSKTSRQTLHSSASAQTGVDLHNLCHCHPVRNMCQQRHYLWDNMSSQSMVWRKTHTTSTSRCECISRDTPSLLRRAGQQIRSVLAISSRGI